MTLLVIFSEFQCFPEQAYRDCVRFGEIELKNFGSVGEPDVFLSHRKD